MADANPVGPDHVAASSAVYDASIELYLDAIGTEIGPATEHAVDRALLAAFVELLPEEREGSPARRVADVGCGPGRVAGFLAARGVEVVGVDPSARMLDAARAAHPGIPFEDGRLDALPFADGALAGVVCWYSIINTPPDLLGPAFTELARVVAPGGIALLAFQADAEPLHREDAFGTGLPLTSYRHAVDDVQRRLGGVGFSSLSTTVREPAHALESTPQAVLLLRRGPGTDP